MNDQPRNFPEPHVLVYNTVLKISCRCRNPAASAVAWRGSLFYAPACLTDIAGIINY